MPRKSSPKPPKVGVHMSPPELWSFEFSRNEGESPDLPSELPISFGIGFNRIAEDVLGVELSVEVPELRAAKIKVAYRAEFQLVPDGGAAVDDAEASFRSVAAFVAPTAIYPFIRETVATTALKAGMPSLLLPVINFRSFFNPEEFVIPPFEGGGENTEAVE